MPRRTYKFFTPIPPMVTGTAGYFEKILRRILSTGLVPLDDVVVVTDSRFVQAGLPDTFLGVRVVDFRQMPYIVGPSETWFLFLANNELHGFVHEIIDGLQKLPNGKVVTIVHEPSNYMLLRNLGYNRLHGYSEARVVEGLLNQFGSKGKKLLHDADLGLTDNIFNHVVLAQDGLYENSDEIWTHSRYAATVLETESRWRASKNVFKVYAHPRDDITRYAIAGQRSKPVFRIGVFGWISLAKRVREVLVGLRLAIDRMDYGARHEIELIIVGKLPSDPSYDISGISEFLHLSANVRILGYQPDEEFERLVPTCDLIFNLRFPSCGETSGTINLAQGAGAKVVKSNYQAMHEEPAHEAITFLPYLESFSIASSICRNYENWKIAVDQSSHEQAVASEMVAAVELGILEVILSDMERQADRNTEPTFA